MITFFLPGWYFEYNQIKKIVYRMYETAYLVQKKKTLQINLKLFYDYFSFYEILINRIELKSCLKYFFIDIMLLLID